METKLTDGAARGLIEGALRAETIMQEAALEGLFADSGEIGAGKDESLAPPPQKRDKKTKTGVRNQVLALGYAIDGNQDRQNHGHFGSGAERNVNARVHGGQYRAPLLQQKGKQVMSYGPQTENKMENGTGTRESPGNNSQLEKKRIGNIELWLGDCMEMMKSLPDGSIDIVLTDPPYMYLKHRLDRPFDLDAVYREMARLLNPARGAVIVFGRGPSFYRTGALLENMGLRFMEEVVWHKARRSSPVTPLGRVHETVSIWGIGKATVNRVRVPVADKLAQAPERMEALVREMSKILRNEGHLEAVRSYFETGEMESRGSKDRKPDSLVLSSDMRNFDRRTAHARIIAEGGCEESIIRAGDPDLYNRMHPTQKPVALLKRLLALVMPPDRAPAEITVIDPFGGSFSTMAACIDTGTSGVSCEILPDYFHKGARRIEAQARKGRQMAMSFPVNLGKEKEAM